MWLESWTRRRKNLRILLKLMKRKLKIFLKNMKNNSRRKMNILQRYRNYSKMKFLSTKRNKLNFLKKIKLWRVITIFSRKILKEKMQLSRLKLNRSSISRPLLKKWEKIILMRLTTLWRKEKKDRQDLIWDRPGLLPLVWGKVLRMQGKGLQLEQPRLNTMNLTRNWQEFFPLSKRNPALKGKISAGSSQNRTFLKNKTRMSWPEQSSTTIPWLKNWRKVMRWNYSTTN